jgi:D-lactate dehydrogenase
MKVVFFSTKSYDREFFERLNADSRHQLTYFETLLNPETANLANGFGAVCVFVNDKLDETTIRELAAGGVKIIALRCAGFNNVDLKAAAENKIKVVRVPAYSPEAVAEHAVALILTLNRKTHKAYNRVRESNFSLEKLTGFNLYGKTVGVVGTGMIGAAFCRIMLGFGCKVIAYDPYPVETLQQLGVQYVPLEQLFETSDIVSLHCPLTPQTQYLINPESLSKMKDGVMLINTGRGALIDTQAVIHALKSCKLGFLGLDVYEQESQLFFQDLSESIIQDDLIGRLMSFPNVLITAHQGFFTREALEQIATITLQNLSDFEAGKPLENEVKS